MTSGARRLALQQLDARGPGVPDLPRATVVTVAAGAGSDGESLVTVDYLGARLDLPHMAHYTPLVDDVVALIRVGGIWTIFGRPVGFPTT